MEEGTEGTEGTEGWKEGELAAGEDGEDVLIGLDVEEAR